MSSTEPAMVRNVVEAALLAAGEPVTIDRLATLFEVDDGVGRSELRTALDALADSYAERGLELREVSSGWRVQVRADLAPWVSRLWESRPARYSRALLETLALIAYQQPITRGDIEQVRGVSVSSNIIKTLLDRDWIRIVGHRDVPGRPALYGTTRTFLDYFDLRSLDQLPPLAEIRDLAKMNEELGFEDDAGGDTDGDGESSGEVVPLSAVLGEFERDAEAEAIAAGADALPEDRVDADADADPGADDQGEDDAEAAFEEEGDLDEPAFEAAADAEEEGDDGETADAGGAQDVMSNADGDDDEPDGDVPGELPGDERSST